MVSYNSIYNTIVGAPTWIQCRKKTKKSLLSWAWEFKQFLFKKKMGCNNLFAKHVNWIKCIYIYTYTDIYVYKYIHIIYKFQIWPISEFLRCSKKSGLPPKAWMKPVANSTNVDWLADFWTINRILIGGRVTVLVDFNFKSFCIKLSGFSCSFLMCCIWFWVNLVMSQVNMYGKNLLFTCFKTFVHQIDGTSHQKLVGGFNPIEKYARQIGSFPRLRWK